MLTRSAIRVVDGHGSQNVAGHGAVGRALAVAAGAALVALWVAFAHGPADRERLVRYAGACVCAFVVFGKVLSPQYLIWLVPLVALVGGRRGIAAIALLAAALVATQVWFPDHYWDYVYDLDRAWVVLAAQRAAAGAARGAALPWPRALSRAGG